MQTPLNILATELGLEIDSIAESRYDDTSLALLYSQLKPMSLQTMKGASEIPGQTEFNFVKQIARVFCRMGRWSSMLQTRFNDQSKGCHVLALDLVKNWTFTTPEDLLPSQPPVQLNGQLPHLEPAPQTQRPPLAAHHHRRPSILIDMDLSSEPASRTDDPSQLRLPSPIPENGTLSPPQSPTLMQRQTSGFGTLLKSAKKVSRVAEFDMSSFGDFSLSASPAPSSPAPTPLPDHNTSPSPPKQKDEAPPKDVKPKGIGSLMAPKKTVDVPEFDMNSFF